MVWILKVLTPQPTHDTAAHIADIAAGRVRSRWLRFYDPNAYGGQGYIAFTEDHRQAMPFDSFEAAMKCWQQQSAVRPLRADGQPNRPLTAYTVEPISVR
jgi:hypothetical protein